MDLLKKTIIAVCSALLAFLEPIQNTVYLLLFLYVINLASGIWKDVFINRNRFYFKKFVWSCLEFLVYVGIVCGIYVIGFFQNDRMEAQYIIKVISYLYIYAYSTNILKNLILIFPNSMTLKFMYYVLSFEFIKKIPFLSDFLKQQNNEAEK